MERIGMIQSLFYYETGQIWDTFFQNAGYEVVHSKPAVSCDVSINEACQPIRNCLLHIQNLIERRVDWIFIPRVVSYAKGYCSCPKIQGVCDVAGMMATSQTKLLSPVWDINQGKYQGVYQLGKQLGIPARAVKYMYKEALKWNQKLPGTPQEPYIAVLGHPYVLQDPQMGLPVIRYFLERGYRVATAEEQPEAMLLQKGRALKERRMFWYTAQKQIGYSQMLTEISEMPEGVLYISAFGCGIDEYIWPYCEKIIAAKRPFMHLKLDHQYHEAGLATRLEAFQDMMERTMTI